MEGKETKENIIFGLALASCSLEIVTIVFLFPSYLGSSVLSLFVKVILLIIGVIGLGVELSKIVGENKISGVSDFFLGLFFLVIWGVLHHFFPQILINWILLVFLIPGIFGITLGSMKFVSSLFENNTGLGMTITKSFLVIAQIITIGAAILQSLQILKIIN